jgi:hypothetical protein
MGGAPSTGGRVSVTGGVAGAHTGGVPSGGAIIIGFTGGVLSDGGVSTIDFSGGHGCTMDPSCGSGREIAGPGACPVGRTCYPESLCGFTIWCVAPAAGGSGGTIGGNGGGGLSAGSGGA